MGGEAADGGDPSGFRCNRKGQLEVLVPLPNLPREDLEHVIGQEEEGLLKGGTKELIGWEGDDKQAELFLPRTERRR